MMMSLMILSIHCAVNPVAVFIVDRACNENESLSDDRMFQKWLLLPKECNVSVALTLFLL